MKHLVYYKKRSYGRNNRGVITSRFRCKGNKKLYRRVLFNRSVSSWDVNQVVGFSYDPNRNAFLCVVGCVSSQVSSFSKPGYLLSAVTLQKGTIIYNLGFDFNKSQEFLFSVGTAGYIGQFPVGSLIHSVELRPGQGGVLCRAAGSFAQLVDHDFVLKKSKIRLPSGSLVYVSFKCFAVLGVVGNLQSHLVKLRKAGISFWAGRRPRVRGVAINPVDHPHGGGEGKGTSTKGGVSPWGRIRKGQKTR